MQKEWQVEWVPIKTIKSDPNNRNQHPKEQIDRLSQLMTHYGWVGNPLVVSTKSGLLKAGEGRLLAAKKAKLKKVPAHFNDFITEEDEYGFGVADNAITSWAELQLAQINQDLGDLGPDFDIDLLGIKNFYLEPADKYIDEINSADETAEWVDMPEFKEGKAYIKLTYIFKSKQSRKRFVEKNKLKINNSQNDQWIIYG